jgi:calcium-dependent protein kinase
MGCLQLKKKAVQPHSQMISTMQDFKLMHTDFIKANTGNFYNFYKLGDVLGAGSYSEVRRCVHKITDSVRAVKIFRREEITPGTAKSTKLLSEIEILRSVDHPNVVRIYEFFESPRRYYLVMEYCKGGELLEMISKKRRFTEAQAAQIMRQLFSVVAFLHARGIVHRDLKPENILLEDKYDELSIKIVDFGAATYLDERGQASRIAGTAYYIAPEVLTGSYDEKCDVWSCGVILYILLSGVPPFTGKTDKQVLSRVRTGAYSLNLDEFRTVSAGAKELISKLMCPAQVRHSAAQALNHNWVQTNYTSVVPSAQFMASVFRNMKTFSNKTKMRDAVKTFIITQLLTTSDTRELREVFMCMDRNADGKLSPEELRDSFSAYMPVDEAQAEVERVMGQIDIDQNGYIDYTEFLRASVDVNKLVSKSRLENAFLMFDTDGSGKISAGELKSMLNFENVDSQLWQQIISEVDENGDGEIDIEEFKNLLIDKI